MLPSIFEIFKIGIGPSSSHTLGALNCAKDFILRLESIITEKVVIKENLQNVKALKKSTLYKYYNSDQKIPLKIQIELLGSFALTGKGHLTDIAAIAGLTGYKISHLKTIYEIYDKVKKQKFIKFKNLKLKFDPVFDVIWNTKLIDLKHPNTIKFMIVDERNNIPLIIGIYNSIGGGNIKLVELKVKEKNSNYKNFKIYKSDLASLINDNVDKIINIQNNKKNIKSNLNNNYKIHFNEFNTLETIIKFCLKENIDYIEFNTLYQKVFYNISKISLRKKLKNMWAIMSHTIEKGLQKNGILPGKLKLQRRAKRLYDNYLNNIRSPKVLSNTITLASIYAIATSEENADGNVIITAPTCGSAGVLPAVLKVLSEKYYIDDSKIVDALLVAGLIGMIVFKNASISGAEVGCQGEIGTASSMAAAAATFLLGGNLNQIEYAAEIALEHHLGLTCDPVDGLVQIPCIERNAVGAVTALNSANLALLSSNTHHISFDKVVLTMKETGIDMNEKYKETSLGGLAKIFKC